jgi:Fructose-bisphosphate aldolase class-II
MAFIRPSQKSILHGSKKSSPEAPLQSFLHGGTGLSNETFKKLIAAGCAKVNISTMLKMRFADSFRNYLEAEPKEYDPIEDSRNGLLSGNSAGIRVLVTTSWFTTGEDFSEARLVVSALGDPEGERSEVRANRTGHPVGEYVRLEDLAAV